MNLGLISLITGLFSKSETRIGGSVLGQIISGFKGKETLKKMGVDIDKSERLQEEYLRRP